MSRFLCNRDELSDQGKEVILADASPPRYLMLFLHGEQVLAFENACPHQGRSLNFAPDRFFFAPQGWLVCTHHGACFELPSGKCISGPCKGDRLKAVEITERDQQIFLVN